MAIGRVVAIAKGANMALNGQKVDVAAAFKLTSNNIIAGVIFGLIFGLVGYAMTRGRRDFSSIQQVVATKYEVLVEHKHAEQARNLLAGLPGALPNPFA